MKQLQQQKDDSLHRHTLTHTQTHNTYTTFTRKNEIKKNLLQVRLFGLKLYGIGSGKNYIRKN